jgi:hypothetical protein
MVLLLHHRLHQVPCVQDREAEVLSEGHRMGDPDLAKANSVPDREPEEGP